MARQLIDDLAAKWDPAKYTDEYKDNLMRVIRRQNERARRRPLVGQRSTVPHSADVVDLMSRLRASLAGKRDRWIQPAENGVQAQGRSPPRRLTAPCLFGWQAVPAGLVFRLAPVVVV